MSDEMTVTHHMSDDRLLAFLDGELSSAERADVAGHIDACTTCAAELEALRAATRRLTSALERIDRPAPLSFRLSDARRRSRGERWALSSLAKAAVLVLIVGGASAAAIPGSPVREWLGETVERLRGRTGPADVAPDATATVRGVSGVAIAPLNGSLVIRLRDTEAGTLLRVVLVDAEEASVWTAGARYRTAPGRIEVLGGGGGGGGEVRVEIPRSVARATVEVDGELLLTKEGEALRLLAPAADSAHSELLFRVGG